MAALPSKADMPATGINDPQATLSPIVSHAGKELLLLFDPDSAARSEEAVRAFQREGQSLTVWPQSAGLCHQNPARKPIEVPDNI